MLICCYSLNSTEHVMELLYGLVTFLRGYHFIVFGTIDIRL